MQDAKMQCQACKSYAVVCEMEKDRTLYRCAKCGHTTEGDGLMQLYQPRFAIPEETEHDIHFRYRINGVRVYRYKSRRDNEWRTSIDIYRVSLPELVIGESIRSAKELVVLLQKAIEEAEAITPPEED